MPRPFEAALTEMAENCVCARLRRATRAVTNTYDAALRPLDLRATQMTLLVALAHFDQVSFGKLGDVLSMDRTTLTRNVGPLERKKLVRVESDRGDARRKLLSLTPKGRETLVQALPLWRKVQREAVSKLGETQWRSIRQRLAVLEEGA